MKVPLPHYPFIGKKFWPDLLALSGSSIHPLIGSLLPNATSSKLFQSALNLRSLEYVRDHAIGDNVIFPGAGYLEMCLASGLATVEGATDSLPAPSRPMKVENLSILAPLPIQEGKTCQLQTIAELNTCPENEMDWNDLTLKIFRRVDDSSASTKWLPHATAIFSPLLSTEEKSVSFDAKQFKATLSTPSNNGILSEIYDKLASVGLKFGPAFRSIEKLWRGEDKDKTLLAKIKLPSDDPSQQQQYIVHPVVLDAMIQAVMMLRLTDGIKKKLYVPIKIGKFVWLAQPSEECSGELYIHAISSSSRSDGISEDSAILIDSLGKPLAIMSSVEFIDTTVKALEAVLEQQMSCLPDLWECKWKLTDSPIEQPIDLKLASVPFNDEAFESFIEETFNKPPVEHAQTFRELELLVYFNSLRALYECGWEPQLHLIMSEDELLTELKIQSEFGKYLGFMMEVLEAEGILERRGEKEGGCIIRWEVVKIPPSLEKTMTLLNSSLYGDDLSSKFYPTILLNNFGKALCGILKGKIGALSILFPDESKGSPSVADFYSEYAVKFRLGEWAKTICTKRYNHVVSRMEGKSHLIRILEVGAGTGSYTADFLKGLEEAGVNYEYTYTDISAAFFSGAQKRFEKHLSRMIFKKLNIEEDPIQQGFRPEYYDWIYIAEMIHATRDIKESLRNLRMVMRPYAKLDMLEGTRVNRLISYLFGALEGFWRFQDFDLRQRHCILSKKTWVDVYQSSGFHVEGVFSILNDYHSFVSCYKLPDPFPLQANHQRMSQQVENSKLWILFHCKGSPVSCFLQKALATVPGRRVLLVTEGNSFQELKNNEGYKLRGSSPEDFVALFNSILSKNLSLEGIIYLWSLDPKRTNQDEILQPFFHLVQKKITIETKSETRIVAFCTGGASLEDKDLSHFHSSTISGFVTSLRNEHVEINCRCVDIPFDQEALDEEALRGIFLEVWNSDREVRVALQGKSRYVTRLHRHKPNNTPLKFPNGTDRFHLILPESRSISDLALNPLDSYDLAEDEVEVQINASALNFRDVLSVLKPSEEFKNINMVGFDFSGVVKRLGEKVTKWRVGDRVSGCNMRNQTFPSHVKIHEDLLLNIPDNITMCEAATIPAVYVTSVVCLLETAKIKKEDVVLLHTATGGVGLSAIEICKYVGCTIIATAGSKRKRNYLRRLGIQHIFHSRNTQFGDEILKVTNGRGVDVVLNSLTSEGFKEATLKACAKGARFVEMSMLNIWTAEEVRKLRPDVEYTIIDVSVADRRMWVRIMEVLKELMDTKVIKPIPYVTFDGLNIREALQYLQKAKHIGKIVCTMPELRKVGGELKVYTAMFNDRSTYLITGGLGGIGFLICQWMIEKGAKHVLIAGRRPPTLQIQSRISELNSTGANVIPIQLDVGNFEQCKKIIHERIPAMGLPPLRGVMHAAGTLHDGFIVNQDWEKLSSTFNTKVNGTLNLHELTKSHNLEHFVMFSSMASLFGPPGQCNHSAGNCFEDMLVHYRNSMGLPATSVNWGQWGEVGVATEVDIAGLNAMSNLQALSALEYALKTQRPQIGAANVESFVMLSKLIPYLSVYIDERIWKKSASNSAVTIRSDEFWQQYDFKVEMDKKKTLVQEQLMNIVRSTLKLDDSEVLDEQSNFQEMGVDSLMYVEMKNAIQTLVGDRVVVNSSVLKDCNTISSLADSIVKLIEGTLNEDIPKLSKDEVIELMREDCQLPSHISPSPDQVAPLINEIKRVLLTGCTGTLGPYVLQRLASDPQITQVICLMRPRQPLSPEERLRKELVKKDIVLPQVQMEKVRCVTGDVGLSKLGLSPQEWEELKENTEAIVHCAVHVDHTEYYGKGKSQVRVVNIEGTKKVLEFACEGRLKHVYLAASLLSVSTVDEEGQMSDGWLDFDDYTGVTPFAYPISKFVGDMLMKEAVERGVPGKAFRLPLIVGDSKTGRCSVHNNHYLLRYFFIMKNGIMPSNPVPTPMLPVDVCADVSVRLFLDEKAGSGVYNITHCSPSVDQEFASVAKKFGYDVDIVELAEFGKRVRETTTKGSALAMFSEFYSDEDKLMEHYSEVPILKWWMEGNQDIWCSKKVSALLPNFYAEQKSTMEYVYNDLMFLKSQGWFEKGINVVNLNQGLKKF